MKARTNDAAWHKESRKVAKARLTFSDGWTLITGAPDADNADNAASAATAAEAVNAASNANAASTAAEVVNAAVTPMP